MQKCIIYRYCLIKTVLLLLFMLNLNLFAQVSAGDIIFVGYNADAPDGFAFMATTDIAGNSEIRFTDNGWQSSGSFSTGESELVYTVASGGLSKGDWIAIDSATPSVLSGGGSVVQVSVGYMSLSSGGDQVIAFTGSLAAPTPIAALQMNGGAWGDAYGCALPTGLVDGETAFVISPEIDNGVFDCTEFADASLSTIQSTINNSANWTLDNSNNQDLTGCTPIGLPVELVSFRAVLIDNIVQLNWTTATEVNNYGFEIEKALSPTAPVQGWETIGFVPGHGNSNSPKHYEFIDDLSSAENLVSDGIRYRLKQIDTDGSFEYFNTIAEVENGLTNVDEIEIPEEFGLSQNYPNPFNPTTTIKVSIQQQGHYSLKVYNSVGQEVHNLFTGSLGSGYYDFVFDGKNLSSGLYLYKLTGREVSMTRKMLLVK